MPKIAVVSDIHGNLPALRAVINDICRVGVDMIFSLGDVVGYGPYSYECADLIFGMKDISVKIRGNHEDLLSLVDSDPFRASSRANDYALEALKKAKRSMPEDLLRALSSLPKTKYLSELDIGLAHGSYASNDHSDTYLRNLLDMEEERQKADLGIILVGHTHRPLFFSENKGSITLRRNQPDRARNRFENGDRLILNPGSVGQPRDGDPRASYGILYLGHKYFWFQIRRINYDIVETQMAMKRDFFPDFLISRLSKGA